MSSITQIDRGRVLCKLGDLAMDSACQKAMDDAMDVIVASVVDNPEVFDGRKGFTDSKVKISANNINKLMVLDDVTEF